MNNRVQFLGSIKLAVPLLTVIVGVLIWATFYEAQVGSAIVQHQIYKSPWFGALMFLLALNLGVSALSRYPWRGARKIGFALTHLGLIVIIAGSAAVIHLGVEGMLTLRIDGGFSNQIRVEGEQLEVMIPQENLVNADLLIKPDGSVNVHEVAGLTILDYSDNTVKTVNFREGAEVDNWAVKLELSSDRLGQNLERWLAVAPVAYSEIDLGPAELEIIEVEDKSQLDQQLSPPAQNISPLGKLQVISKTGDAVEIDVEKNLGQILDINNLQIKIVNFWSDFRLDANNQPTNASAKFRNPALQLEVTDSESRERWFLFGGDFPPVRSLLAGQNLESLEIGYTVPPQPVEDYFRVIVDSTGEFYYAARSSGGFQSGRLEIGRSVTPGWADFIITLASVIPHAQIDRQVVPVTNQEGTPALLVATEADNKVWLPWGEPATINSSEGEIYAAFSPKLLQLPLAVALEDFIVERNEGSESVAMWTSKIRLYDPETGTNEIRNVWMNHPTWYRGWKIAQASWNPGDLKQSTLQVKREPALVTALTWTGSALIVLGIGVMFYGGAIAQKFRRKPSKTTPELEQTPAKNTKEKELVTTK